ncbi:glycine cleavage system protein H [bacterium]|nr:glycine cleavage system protein H [bacterium]
MDVKGYDHREDLLYHKEFCWVKTESDDTVTIGLNDFYCKLAGEISYVDMPDEEEEISKDERIGTVETGKWVGKLIAPLSGEITEINEIIEDDPAQINEKPYDTWLFKMKLSNPSELDELMKGDDAVKWLEQEIKEHK